MRRSCTGIIVGAISVAAGLGVSCAPAVASEPLPALGADIRQTSVSGLSSGAYMAGQFQLAHAEIVVGAAIVAAGPYGCAESEASRWLGGTATNLTMALNACMQARLLNLGYPNATTLARRAEGRAGRGEIGPLEAIRRQRVLVFSGTLDEVVVPAVVRATAAFYRAIGLPEAAVKLVADVPAGHAFVSRRAERACAHSGAPYLVNCDYDLAGVLLRHIHGPLKLPAKTPNGRFFKFDQTRYAAAGALMAREGVVYVPANCSVRSGCRIHVAYHGCRQALEHVGMTFVERSGIARWADTNRMVVLFPQMRSTTPNPRACWDWWGYTGTDFLTRAAPQISAVRAMIDRLAATARR